MSAEDRRREREERRKQRREQLDAIDDRVAALTLPAGSSLVSPAAPASPSDLCPIEPPLEAPPPLMEPAPEPPETYALSSLEATDSALAPTVDTDDFSVLAELRRLESAFDEQNSALLQQQEQLSMSNEVAQTKQRIGELRQFVDEETTRMSEIELEIASLEAAQTRGSLNESLAAAWDDVPIASPALPRPPSKNETLVHSPIPLTSSAPAPMSPQESVRRNAGLFSKEDKGPVVQFRKCPPTTVDLGSLLGRQEKTRSFLMGSHRV